MTKLSDSIKRRQAVLDSIRALQLDAKEIEQKLKNLKAQLERLNEEIKNHD